MKISLDVSMLEAGEWCSWAGESGAQLLRAKHAAKNCEGG